jgi:hypothetical protein
MVTVKVRKTFSSPPLKLFRPGALQLVSFKVR